MDEHLSSRVTSVAAEVFQYRQGCRHWYSVGAVVIKRAQLAYLTVRDGRHFAKSMTRHSGRDQSRDLLGTVSPVRDGGPASRMLKLSGITPVVQPPSPPWNVLPPPLTPPLTAGADLRWTPASGGRLAVPDRGREAYDVGVVIRVLARGNDDSPLTVWWWIPWQEVFAHSAVDVIMLTDGTEKPLVGGDEKVRAR